MERTRPGWGSFVDLPRKEVIDQGKEMDGVWRMRARKEAWQLRRTTKRRGREEKKRKRRRKREEDEKREGATEGKVGGDASNVIRRRLRLRQKEVPVDFPDSFLPEVPQPELCRESLPVRARPRPRA